MSKFEVEKYNKFKKELEDINKKLINYENKENRPLPADPIERKQRINEYKIELTDAYNNYITYIGTYYKNLPTRDQNKAAESIRNLKLRILRALKAINLSLDLPRDFDKIDIHAIDNIDTVFNESINTGIFVRASELSQTLEPTEVDGAVGGVVSQTDNIDDNNRQQQIIIPNKDIQEQNSDQVVNNPHSQVRVNANDTTNNQSDVTLNSNTINHLVDQILQQVNNNDNQENNANNNDNNQENNANNNNHNQENTRNTENRMSASRKEFLRLAASMLNKYDGDPLQLNSFIDSVELLKEMVEDADKDVFTKLVKSRLEGTAREVVDDNPENVDEIINDLKANIKADSSKVIEGRMLALRTDKTNLSKFSERAEELAEDYRRSLQLEGFSKAKAKELSIEKTVELCRKNARNDTVKAVIAATKFESPKEVISKMIVEINNLKQDRTSTSNNNNNDRGNRNNGNNNSYNNGNNNNFRNNNDRGNRNNNNNNNNNRNNNGNRGGNYNNNRRNEHTIRLIAGNEATPGDGGTAQPQASTSYRLPNN
ncbi:GATA zinc finger domain-containing protein 4-like [Contarinia nasturtii]|uniref:GATA zinc finger domain-containing protein 4-like n=1 Tax=Contarinia nasturtii TaxID=265458 RepID=UPI0012D46208|nr:GATA zinc finger domain-containing protein 4-like [Contarinia nasturtii]